MDVKGGYVIIDLKGQTIGVSGSETDDITGAFARLDNVNKPIIVTNFKIGDEKFYNVFANPNVVDSEITLTFVNIDDDAVHYIYTLFFNDDNEIYYSSTQLGGE